MKTMYFTRFAGLLLLLLIGFSGTSFKQPEAKPCTLNTLSSPPANFYVYSATCTGAGFCNRSSTTLLTLSNAGPCAHTWTFTNVTTGCVKVFNTGVGVGTLQVSIPGSTGDVINLVISDSGGGSGPTYVFNGVSC